MKPKIRIPRAMIALALLLPLAACGEDAPTDAPDSTLLPNRSEDHLIEGVGQPEQVDADPTPQATTGGEIPNYAPVDEGEGSDAGDDAAADDERPADRTTPDVNDPEPSTQGPLPAQ